MKHEPVESCDLVSALVDGQLRGEEFSRAVDWVGSDEHACSTWNVYHMVGDIMRSEAVSNTARDVDFLARLRSAVRQESITRSGSAAGATQAIEPVAAGRVILKTEAANQARFHWKRLAGFASLAAVALIGWQTWSEWGDQRAAPQMAQATPQVPAPDVILAQSQPSAQPVMIRDPQLDALLAAHKQFGGTSAFQVPTGFLRNATFEGEGR